MLREPDFSAEERGTYGEALDALELSRVPYMLGGALALHAYTGIWRDTKDLDIFVQGEAVERVLEVLKKAGFETEIQAPHWLAKGWKGELFVDVIHANDNGIGAVDASWYEHAGRFSVLGRDVLVIPPEEMLISKLFVAFRDRSDLSDVLHLIFVRRGGLDWERILLKLEDHLELLLAYLHLFRYVYPSHAHYVPERVFNVLTERCREDLERLREGPLRFRGMMLDGGSFAVDVEAWGLPDERAVNREARP